ncbi:hypothetical protein P170DRAFT_404162 [Aspergillus steynii IBT 23096]|uniref:Rad2-like endonuclease n=1 Tax=Aspergillus steynii IBT 23096 TaxID=1392250 RepID=A0A2I2GK20_9EURO|nr:uncharacterized protein P170DRAFT_404162 [Aspergillus steynii IBT 23096]PLB53220.1 hypothetical protein P170DRAFT_404162 [Aspergillus steynii IBT 23096]
MGIPGLINAIGTGERISLSRLAVNHLERTARPIRIAVDISIWLFQVQAGRGGTNPELRTLFYRLLKLLALPIHPLFVYDGKEKPPFKRGKASGGSAGNLPIIRLSKVLVDLFKFPRHDAPGEAEAECARLQTAGVVDAVMSNDVDALMFGSSWTVMNFSKESGSGTTAATHVTCYRMGDGEKNPSVAKLDRAGMILFAMLSGGDYLPSGVPKCGNKLAAEIARAGFGADLLEIINSNRASLETQLSEWRERLQYELEENESGYFTTKHKAVRVPESFPDKTILSYYAKPVVSTQSDISSLRSRLVNAWDQDLNPLELRTFAANAFEWNYRSGARKMIRLLAEPLVSYRLRLGKPPSAFADNEPKLSDVDAPMLQKVYKSRTSFSTDGLTELQLDFVPIDVVGLDLFAEEPNPPLPSQETTANVSGDEEDALEEPAAPQSPVKKRVTKRYDPLASEKIWIFETLASIGIPQVVQNWKKEEAEKSAPKKPAGRKTGPRKKGPIDPGMKRGSILKYGTLTKERSEISQFRNASLLEAAVSGTPSKNGSSTPGQASGSTAPSGTSYGNDFGFRMPAFDQDLGFDDLTDRFSLFCNVSPDAGIKRHPLMNRSRGPGQRRAVAPGAEVEVLDIIDSEPLDCSPPAATPRLRMSYSNSSYEELSLADSTANAAHSSSPDHTARRPKSKPARSKHQESSEVQELEQAVSSIILEDIDGSPKKSTKPRSRRSKIEPSIPKKECKEAKSTPDPSDHPTPSTKSSPSRVQDLLEKASLDMPSLRKQQRKNTPSSTQESDAKPSTFQPKTTTPATSSREAPATVSHVDSIVACDGYWTVDADPESELVSNGKKGGAKQRFRRVSVLDLT